MSMRLNQGNKSFQMILNSDIYVDKTMLIAFTNKHINTYDRYICVNRPRRFGKTINANMLASYYSKGCNSTDLFKNLSISKDESFLKHINKYNVITIDMFHYFNICNTINDILKRFYSDLIRAFKLKFGNINTFDKFDNIVDLLNFMFDEYEEQFIFIIDEWDSPLRYKTISEKDKKSYLSFINDIFKDKDYVALVYMTGILPIKKYGSNSALNMFNEYTVINSGELSHLLGFTEAEINSILTTNVSNKDINNWRNELKNWYDGYTVNNIHIYNPRSVISAITNHKCDLYWTKTETYEELKQYIQRDDFDLRLIITKLLNNDIVTIDYTVFNNDINDIHSSDDILTVLIHLGYLTARTYQDDISKLLVSIPNKEIRCQFDSTLKAINYTSVLEALNKSKELIKATFNCEEEIVANIIEQIHNENTSIIQYNNENSLSCVITLAYYSIKDTHDIYRELPTGIGFADIVFIPKFNNKSYTDIPIIIELKYDKSTKAAIDQIKNKKYIMCLHSYHGDVLLVRINYNKNTKKHECSIERINI